MKQLHIKNYLGIRKDYFLEVFLPAFSIVKDKSVPISKTYLIADKHICLNFYTRTLCEKLTRALAHNEIQNTTKADLVVNLWDTESANVDLVAPWIKENYIIKPQTTTTHQNTEKFKGAYIEGEETLSLYDEEKEEAYFWTRNAEKLADWLSASPIRTILHWFLSANNIHLIHGATVGSEGQAVLISAKSGSGKSTTALSCLLAGFNYLADDYIAVEINNHPTAHSLYNSVKITPDSLKIFPELATKIWNTKSVGGQIDKGKAIMFLLDIFPDKILKKSPLSAILIPIINKQTRIIPASKLQAMMALAPTTLLQLPMASSNKMQELKEIVNALPCYFLELGPDIRNTHNVIKYFLENEL